MVTHVEWLARENCHFFYLYRFKKKAIIEAKADFYVTYYDPILSNDVKDKA